MFFLVGLRPGVLVRLAVRWMREKGLLLRVFAPAPPGAGATVCGSSRGLIECRILRLDQRTPSWRPPSGPRARRACPSLMRPAVSARRRERCQNSHVCRNCRGETPLSRTNASARRNDFSNRICRNFRDLQLARRQQKFWRALSLDPVEIFKDSSKLQHRIGKVLDKTGSWMRLKMG